MEMIKSFRNICGNMNPTKYLEEKIKTKISCSDCSITFSRWIGWRANLLKLIFEGSTSNCKYMILNLCLDLGSIGY